MRYPFAASAMKKEAVGSTLFSYGGGAVHGSVRHGCKSGEAAARKALGAHANWKWWIGSGGAPYEGFFSYNGKVPSKVPIYHIRQQPKYLTLPPSHPHKALHLHLVQMLTHLYLLSCDCN